MESQIRRAKKRLTAMRIVGYSFSDKYARREYLKERFKSGRRFEENWRRYCNYTGLSVKWGEFKEEYPESWKMGAPSLEDLRDKLIGQRGYGLMAKNPEYFDIFRHILSVENEMKAKTSERWFTRSDYLPGPKLKRKLAKKWGATMEDVERRFRGALETLFEDGRPSGVRILDYGKGGRFRLSNPEAIEKILETDRPKEGDSFV